MLCRRCEALSRRRARQTRVEKTADVWGAELIKGVECTLCGATLDANDIAQLISDKHSQLAQFGLVSPAREPR